LMPNKALVLRLDPMDIICSIMHHMHVKCLYITAINDERDCVGIIDRYGIIAHRTRKN
jgi:hypothetical protein